MRVTDLEKFAREHVWMPYWPSHPDSGVYPSSKIPSYTLDQTLETLKTYPDYRVLVIRRLKVIGVTFPSYIQHPLVDFIKEELSK